MHEAPYTVEKKGNSVVKVLFWFVVILVVGSLVYGVYYWQQQKVDELNQQMAQLNSQLEAANKQNPVQVVPGSYTSKKGVVVKVYTPEHSSRLTSPVVVLGKVPGNWSFEASFPVKILDGKDDVVAQAPAQLLSDWMTEKLVPFSVTLTYSSTASGDGTLVLQKDNPSGLEANDDSVSIPIKL